MIIKKNFTLVELLVVVAIIGILVSILLPSLDKAREKTRSAVCKSNLKQIGVAALMWSSDNNDKTLAAAWHINNPAWTWHHTSLTPYTGTDRTETQTTLSGLYHCPSLTRERLKGTGSISILLTA